MTLATAPDSPADLSVKRIALLPGAPGALAVASCGDKGGVVPGVETQFTDGPLGSIWAPLTIRGGDFARDARRDTSGFAVAMAPGLGGARTGFYTPDAVLWLQDLRDDAETSLNRTGGAPRRTGFSLALIASGAGNCPDCPPAPSLVFSGVPDGDGTRAARQLNPEYAGET